MKHHFTRKNPYDDAQKNVKCKFFSFIVKSKRNISLKLFFTV